MFWSLREAGSRSDQTSCRLGPEFPYQGSAEIFMPVITIYTKQTCPYCVRAKALLTSKGAAFDEVDIERSPERRPEMIKRAGGRTTVPQIFIGEVHVGGCDDIHALDAAGKLQPMLAA
jgi:glutaredoxin 3